MGKTMLGMKGNEPGWLNKMRIEGMEAYSSTPLPTQFDEGYRYTSLDGFNEGMIEHREKAEIELKGKVEDGVIFMPLEKALAKHEELIKKYILRGSEAKDKFVSLNTALWDSGVFLYVPENVAVKEPLSAAFSIGASSFTHTLIIIENGASVNYCEEFSSAEAKREIMNSGVAEVYVGNNAECTFSSFQSLAKNVWDFSYKYCVLARDARFSWNIGCFGGKLSRVRQDTIFRGEGSGSETVGVFFGTSGQHIDITTNAHHTVAGTTNRILAKGVMAGNGTSVYRGMIRIEKAAQKTDSYLANNILLLSEKALANSIPGLKIDANDVKASHGATVGQIDEEQVFYLMARGLPRKEAEMLIVKGFFDPAISKIRDEGMRERYFESVERMMMEDAQGI